MKTIDSTSPATPTPETSSVEQKVMAGPPTQIIIGGLADPQLVKKGGNFKLVIAAKLVDKDGREITGVTSVWTTTTAGATINRGPGNMNGTFTLNNVQQNTIIQFTVTTQQYPAIRKSVSLRLNVY
ncbi:hypothetical protein PS726_02892 [Pseudomonas fluorescens]|uniref:Uncharacterized protein n=1 Tax=Pseudomonas fluorescens TaxID=294 RepID=A0A8H2RT18_PSEFL|nr:hypothetical protein [Pseudomonas fluorescens]CAG8870305.1 hypothetical protein PS861_03428 [Pseudomonas fluorescens]VVO04136.1 hypothetical protein PS726_02892 [Pseudomonas fluorescens]VVP02624.1 hypothetical protein PS900_02920 [Pseudomonas fluorescens]